jgi:uncharacterized protein VirK/YbjX
MPMSRSLFYTRKILALYGYRRAVYFLMQAQLHRKSFAGWFDFIETALPEGSSDVFKTSLAMRAAYRFLNPQLSAPERIEALTYHYTTLIKRFSSSALSEFMRESWCEIAEMTGQSGKRYVIRMINQISKEGTMRIVVRDTESNMGLAVLVGVIGLDDGCRVFRVGMLRGPGRQAVNGKQMVVSSTRDMNGLRPKQIVLHAAAAVAEWFHAGKIIAPGSQNQVAIKNWFKGHKIYADYDSFWREFVKEAAPDGSYHLSLPLPRRGLADVQPKRRKDWILRYERIDAVSASIKNKLNTLANPATDSAKEN